MLNNRFLIALSLSSLAVLTGCATPAPAPTEDEASTQSSESSYACEGVVVEVNFGILDGENSYECVEFDADSMPAAQVVKDAGYLVEGTAEYGDQIVCRINGMPSEVAPIALPDNPEYVETCQSMPPADAYWALWQKTSAEGKWDYAQEGLGSLIVNKGDSLGLVFTTGGSTPEPLSD
jgi:hypothetical protein